ncbi:WYL domain-containing protein, partial [Vallitalea sediminicola]
RNMELAKREVEPIRIEFSSGQWYLSGFCRYRKDYRKFKLVRISKLRIGEKFTRINNPSSDELQEIFYKSYEHKLVEVKLL